MLLFVHTQVLLSTRSARNKTIRERVSFCLDDCEILEIQLQAIKGKI